MDPEAHIPNNEMEAVRWLELGVFTGPVGLSTDHFLKAWSAIAYLHPELHPDHCFDEEGGWEGKLREFAVEAWVRFEAGQIGEDQLYPSDAQWCGLYDRMQIHTADETRRRESLRVA